MAFKHIIFTTFLILLGFCYVHSQPTGSQQNIYELPPIISVKAKVYQIKESELNKMQMPQNYMIVKTPSENKVYLWEFPAFVPVVTEQPKQKEKGEEPKDTQTAPKETKETKTPASSESLFELAKKLGVGEVKTGTSAEAVKALLNKEIK